MVKGKNKSKKKRNYNYREYSWTKWTRHSKNSIDIDKMNNKKKVL